MPHIDTPVARAIAWAKTPWGQRTIAGALLALVILLVAFCGQRPASFTFN
jgi:hypothetical protein